MSASNSCAGESSVCQDGCIEPNNMYKEYGVNRWHNEFMSQSILEQAHQMLPELQDLRRKLHKNPEFGLELPKTLEVIL